MLYTCRSAISDPPHPTARCCSPMWEAERQYHGLLPKNNRPLFHTSCVGAKSDPSPTSPTACWSSPMGETGGRYESFLCILCVTSYRQAVFDHSSEFSHFLTIFSPGVTGKKNKGPLLHTFVQYFKQASSFSRSFLACWSLSVKVAGKQYHSLLPKNNHTFVPYFLQASSN